MMMSTLTLLGFCLPPGCGEKVSLNLTVLLAFCIFLLNTGEILPNSSEFTSILSEYVFDKVKYLVKLILVICDYTQMEE